MAFQKGQLVRITGGEQTGRNKLTGEVFKTGDIAFISSDKDTGRIAGEYGNCYQLNGGERSWVLEKHLEWIADQGDKLMLTVNRLEHGIISHITKEVNRLGFTWYSGDKVTGTDRIFMDSLGERFYLYLYLMEKKVTWGTISDHKVPPYNRYEYGQFDNGFADMIERAEIITAAKSNKILTHYNAKEGQLVKLVNMTIDENDLVVGEIYPVVKKPLGTLGVRDNMGYIWTELPFSDKARFEIVKDVPEKDIEIKTEIKPEKENKTMTLKVGDKVTISKTLKYGDDYKWWVNDDMEKLAGKTATITRINGNTHSLDIDKGLWSWSIDMFENDGDTTPVTNILTIDKAKAGMKVLCIDTERNWWTAGKEYVIHGNVDDDQEDLHLCDNDGTRWYMTYYDFPNSAKFEILDPKESPIEKLEKEIERLNKEQEHLLAKRDRVNKQAIQLGAKARKLEEEKAVLEKYL